MIQNSAPSTIVRLQCDIRIVKYILGLSQTLDPTNPQSFTFLDFAQNYYDMPGLAKPSTHYSDNNIFSQSSFPVVSYVNSLVTPQLPKSLPLVATCAKR